jgi:hypothetical protein
MADIRVFLVPASQCEAQIGVLFSLIVFNVHAISVIHVQ